MNNPSWRAVNPRLQSKKLSSFNTGDWKLNGGSATDGVTSHTHGNGQGKPKMMKKLLGEAGTSKSEDEPNSGEPEEEHAGEEVEE